METNETQLYVNVTEISLQCIKLAAGMDAVQHSFADHLTTKVHVPFINESEHQQVLYSFKAK